MFLDLQVVVNSVVPDQTAPDQGLHCLQICFHFRMHYYEPCHEKTCLLGFWLGNRPAQLQKLVNLEILDLETRGIVLSRQ